MNRKRKENEVNQKEIVQKLMITLIIILIVAFSYSVYSLIKKPANTASVKNGTLALEESTVRLHYS